MSLMQVRFAAALILALLGSVAAAVAAGGTPEAATDAGVSSEGCSANGVGCARDGEDAALLQVGRYNTVLARGSEGSEHTAAKGTAEYAELAAQSKFCPEGCCADSCNACMEYKDLLRSPGTCRWCPKTQSCHNYLSPLDTCTVPINSIGQCWGQECPVQLGGLLSTRPDAIAMWGTAVPASLKPLQGFRTYSDSTGMFDLATGEALTNSSGGSAAQSTTVTVASDWGSGTCESKVVADLMQKEKPDITLHMGDVYYVGYPEQFEVNVLGKSPNANQVGVLFASGSHSTFLLNGNHEMISGGTGLMDVGFRWTGQNTTFNVYQSDSWRFVNLDTAYDGYPKLVNGVRVVASEADAPQPQQIIDWLVNVVKLGDESDMRGIVIFTHHQPYSDFESAYIGTAKQLNDILPKGKQVVWFAGHEHRLAFYGEVQLEGMDFTFINRMVGNGGMYQEIKDPKRVTSLIAYDNRVYQTIPNDIGGKVETGFNGYFNIAVEGPKLKVSYTTGKCNGDCTNGYDPRKGTLVAAEEISVDLSNGKLSKSFTYLGPELTKAPQLSSSEAEGKRTANSVLTHATSLPRQENVDKDPLFEIKHTSMD